jgi:hypothetical protein
MSEMAEQQRVIERTDLVNAIKALPEDGLVMRALRTIGDDLIEQVSQDLEDPEVTGETGHKLAGRLGGIRAFRNEIEKWRAEELKDES